MLFRHGLNAKQVQGWTGHHSPVFTLSVYVHLLEEDIPCVDLVGRLGSQIAPAGGRAQPATAKSLGEGSLSSSRRNSSKRMESRLAAFEQGASFRLGGHAIAALLSVFGDQSQLT